MMKKLLFTMFILTFVFALVGCDSNKVEDLEVTIKTEEITDDEIHVAVVVPTSIKEVEDLREIAYNIASQVYENNFDEIGASSYLLTIKLYDSTTSFDNNNNTYGQITFDINLSMSQPGLTLNTDSLNTAATYKTN